MMALAVIRGVGSYFETRLACRRRDEDHYRPDCNVFAVRVKCGGIAGMAQRAVARYLEANACVIEPSVIVFYSRRNVTDDKAQAEYVPSGYYTLPTDTLAFMRLRQLLARAPETTTRINSRNNKDSSITTSRYNAPCTKCGEPSRVSGSAHLGRRERGWCTACYSNYKRERLENAMKLRERFEPEERHDWRPSEQYGRPARSSQVLGGQPSTSDADD